MVANPHTHMNKQGCVCALRIILCEIWNLRAVASQVASHKDSWENVRKNTTKYQHSFYLKYVTS